MPLNWEKYVNHIYSVRIREKNTKLDEELKRVGIYGNQIYSEVYYDFSKTTAELVNFKKTAIYSALYDAYKKGYSKVMVLADDVVFNDKNIETVLDVSKNKLLAILNSEDIVEDCFIVSKIILTYIFKQQLRYETQDWYTNIHKEITDNFVAFKPIQMCRHKVDYVVTYVNNTDEQWQQEFSEYKSMATGALSERWRDWGLFKYHLEGVKKFMPWVDNIYVVVSSESQLKGIDTTGVNIVLHKDIIPVSLLPTFNSCTIEMFLGNIPGLSEYFIYANDDMYAVKHIDKQEYWVNNKGRTRLLPINIKANKSQYIQRCLNVWEFASNITSYSIQENPKNCSHRPHPMRKSTYKYITTKYNKEIIGACSQFRKAENFNQYLFIVYDYMEGFLVQDTDVKAVYLNNRTIYSLEKSIQGMSYVCINDQDKLADTEDNVKEYLCTAFNKIYKTCSNSKVIYTCITGNYDELKNPFVITDDFDYICFTDNGKLKSSVWDIKPIPSELLYLSKVKQQRNIKINAHKYLQKYNLSIWVDSSVDIIGNLNKMLDNVNLDSADIFIPRHPQRNCIYDEAKACIKLKKDTEESINTQIAFYKSEGFPEQYGLSETNVIIRKHNSESCKQLMNLWWDTLLKYSHRDQMSLSYCLWKLNFSRFEYLPIGFNHSDYLNWHGGKHKFTNICIIHYNTPKLTEALISSIHKNVQRARIYLFDNSTTNPFTKRYENFIYLDNTKGQYINFDNWLAQYPSRLLSKEKTQTYGSAKHSISVQKCMEIIDDKFILMDSDILLKRNIDGFINSKYVYIGESEQQGNGLFRVLPYLLFINVPLCKKYNIHWFDENYMHGLHLTKESDRYDTGGAFYVHTRNMNYKEVDLSSFIEHYKGGSWENIHNEYKKRYLSSEDWLNTNKAYWQ